MYAVEFQTKINPDGSIAIPPAYRARLHGTIRVIILTDTPTTQPSLLHELLRHPRHVPPFVPFSRDELYARNPEGLAGGNPPR